MGHKTFFPGCENLTCVIPSHSIWLLTIIEITFCCNDLQDNAYVQVFQVTWLFDLVIMFRSIKTFSVCGLIISSYLCVVRPNKGQEEGPFISLTRI